MRALIIKTSSMGDIIHTLPAITDAMRVHPTIEFDWVVEKNFAAIPAWHPAVKHVFPIQLRHWRKNLLQKKTYHEWNLFRSAIRKKKYDYVIDAQGLLKSSFIALHARGKRIGFDFSCVRDPLAALFYQKKYKVAPVKQQHAITRMRDLFCQVLDYSLPISEPDYGIDKTHVDFNPLDFNNSLIKPKNYILFLHGTTWDTKQWPESYWIALAKLVNTEGLGVQLLQGNASEKERAMRIAMASSNVEVLPRLDLTQIATVLVNAKAVVAVDTGLGHLAAALSVPTVSLYSSTNPILTGAWGKGQIPLSATFPCAPCLSRRCTYRGTVEDPAIQPPCFIKIKPANVWKSLQEIVNTKNTIISNNS